MVAVSTLPLQTIAKYDKNSETNSYHGLRSPLNRMLGSGCIRWPKRGNVNIQDLANAVADLKAEAINGKPITPELVAEIAEEYGNIHPARLAKCFIDSYPRPELLSDELQATSHKGWQALRAAEDFKNSLVAYDPWQRRYLEAKWRIYRVTVLGKSDCGRAFVVSQDDSRVLLVEPGELDFEAA